MNSGPIVRIEGLTRRFGPIVAVDRVDLEIARGELFALLGGSGCGKTTLLRMLAGFETPDEGRLFIDGQDMTDVPPYRRPVNMMFQSYALFPHMDVAANVGYGLRRDGVKAPEIAARVAEILKLVHLQDHARRKPSQLSGGQRQRVALARALVKRPKLLLLDEPLAALDRKLRESTRFEMVRLQEQLGLTFVMVTHDQEEAMSMATRLAVMDAGRIAQIGTPHEVYEHPASRFVADFIGIANIIALEGGGWMALRPEKITLSAARPALPQTVAGRIVDVAYEGDRSLYHVETDAHGTMTVSTTNTSRAAGDAFARDQPVWLGWSDEAGQRLEA
ncbi:ABC transporter ATP-binding protein [Reyranella sp.]|uniref:ABC transporter ATP-binding protein n=1 Tax=Reyranella sp. TaxID=1929291 RepID=UPI000BD9CDF6|nr:ABC transporter ATP-binding protein [Reyranella sp.]OYY42641.1 MAG: polyamine ABC transporter ATP-binding protein [Rhodospirillales bacterium 35-66-84]OYZ94413.1 MAG: polyamine ABC transporter ATP-binding protein [Rhodospirillales bacterium 24-66-33]OZB25335.1 MAG: polyamine ABC transporter ATP-binding protein [Rhodospirillales bacterium 39-66-50]HQS16475.1 ABC transporter ATP-binding protein [Reyranella sp.]HQT13425.1 ABC transporter ATP-binding protein [Reyranella sp.]